jgi:hypothetical protein
MKTKLFAIGAALLLFVVAASMCYAQQTCAPQKIHTTGMDARESL